MTLNSSRITIVVVAIVVVFVIVDGEMNAGVLHSSPAESLATHSGGDGGVVDGPQLTVACNVAARLAATDSRSIVELCDQWILRYVQRLNGGPLINTGLL